MGNVKRLIAEEVLPDREHYYQKLWCDLCENIHIHLRNIRLEFSKKEWADLIKHLSGAYHEINKFKDYKENSGTQLMLVTPGMDNITKKSDYYNNRFRIEDEHDGSVHVHYRDIRLHMTREEYNQIANAMQPIED